MAPIIKKNESSNWSDDTSEPIVESNLSAQEVLKILSKLAVDAAGRLRIVIDVAGTATPVSQSGTWNVGAVTSLATLTAITSQPVDQRYEMQQRSKIEFQEVQRNKFTFS